MPVLTGTRETCKKTNYMIVNRRAFFQRLSTAGVAAALPGLTVGCSTGIKTDQTGISMETLEKELTRPVLKRDLFRDPVVISEVELLHYQGSFLCRVRSAEGAEGISVSNNIRMPFLYPIFVKRIAPYFKGKDARDLDMLIDGVYRYRSNYKFQSYALWIPVATMEFAILDMLGRMAGIPMGGLFGDIIRDQMKVYFAPNYREKTAAETVDKVMEEIEGTGTEAVKFKIGMKMGDNDELVPDRTEELIPLARKRLGDRMWLGVDANGGYDAREGIRIGKILDANGYNFYEEPVPFDWYHATKEVADQVSTPVAGGEQEGSMRNFMWMISDNILQIPRQDMFYFGGMVRSVRVARMAQLAGMNCAPHLSGSGLGYLYVMHFISSTPNANDYCPRGNVGEPYPMECRTSSLQVENGAIRIPSDPGLGIEIDPEFIKKHQPVQLL